MRYDPAMRTCGLIVAALILTGVGKAWANEPPALAKARTLYNAGYRFVGGSVRAVTAGRLMASNHLMRRRA